MLPPLGPAPVSTLHFTLISSGLSLEDSTPVQLSEGVIWGGRLGVKEVLYAELGLLQGINRYQKRRGLCEVRGVVPNQWVAAAKGLGFHVHVICFKDKEFECIIKDSVLSPCTLNWEHCRARERHPNIAVVLMSGPERKKIPSKQMGYFSLH